MAKLGSRQEIDNKGAGDKAGPSGKPHRLDMTMHHYLALIDRLALDRQVCQNRLSSPHNQASPRDESAAPMTLSHWVR